VVIVAGSAERIAAALRTAIRTNRSSAIGTFSHGRLAAQHSCVAIARHVFNLAVHDCRKQLLCNPYDEGQFVIFVVSRNLPTALSWKC
jgi:hypothetical protein